MEAEKQLKDRKVYQEVRFSENILTNFVEKSNTMLKNLKRKEVILEKELKYFSFEYKKTTNLGKLYLLPKIHKRFKNVPGRPVISNSGALTEKVSEFLDHHLKPVMQNSRSYIKDLGDFLKKIGNVDNIPENTIWVTADVDVHPNILHNAESREHKAASADDLVKMARFVLGNNYFEFNGDVKNKFQEQRLVYSWMDLQPNFYNPNHCNLWYALNTSIHFLYLDSWQRII